MGGATETGWLTDNQLLLSFGHGRVFISLGSDSAYTALQKLCLLGNDLNSYVGPVVRAAFDALYAPTDDAAARVFKAQRRANVPFPDPILSCLAGVLAAGGRPDEDKAEKKQTLFERMQSDRRRIDPAALALERARLKPLDAVADVIDIDTKRAALRHYSPRELSDVDVCRPGGPAVVVACLLEKARTADEGRARGGTDREALRVKKGRRNDLYARFDGDKYYLGSYGRVVSSRGDAREDVLADLNGEDGEDGRPGRPGVKRCAIILHRCVPLLVHGPDAVALEWARVCESTRYALYEGVLAAALAAWIAKVARALPLPSANWANLLARARASGPSALAFIVANQAPQAFPNAGFGRFTKNWLKERKDENATVAQSDEPCLAGEACPCGPTRKRRGMSPDVRNVTPLNGETRTVCLWCAYSAHKAEEAAKLERQIDDAVFDAEVAAMAELELKRSSAHDAGGGDEMDEG